MSATGPPYPVEIFETTIRDGSYAIDFQFTLEDINLLCTVLERIGFKYIEVGHGFGLNASSVKGASAATDEEYLGAAAAALKGAEFGTFFIPGIGEKEHLKRARLDFGMNFVRIGYDADQIEKTIDYIEYAKDLGYEVMSNFMKSYLVSPRELAATARRLREHGADVVYVVDSAGGMLPEEVGTYVRAVTEETDVRIGFHGHNNLELAVANSLAAYQNGCTLIDCSLGGLGRSAGNTRSELLIPIFRRLGVKLDYDYLGLLKALETYVDPLLRRRFIGPVHIVSGFSRVHSGLMEPFRRFSGQYKIDVKELLYAFGETFKTQASDEVLEPIARQIAAAVRSEEAEETALENALVRVSRQKADAASIRNTFVAVEDLIKAVNSLAKKVNLPVAALINISPTPWGEDYLTADYLYHDNHFIVVRIMFSSLDQFKAAAKRSLWKFDVFVFEGLSLRIRKELGGVLPKLPSDRIILFTSRQMINYHYLFSTIYSLGMEIEAESLLFCGGSWRWLSQYFPRELAHLKCYYAGPEVGAAFEPSSPTVQMIHVDIDGGLCSDAPAFDLTVLLSTLDRRELETVVGCMNSGGVIIDCVKQGQEYRAAIERSGLRLVELDLWKTISGELINLLWTTPKGMEPADEEV